MAFTCDDPFLFDEENSTILHVFDVLQSFYTPQIHGAVCLCICIFGIITNILHVLVLTNSRMRHVAVHAVLTAIAICDATTMMSYLVYLIHFAFHVNVTECDHLMSWAWMQFLRIHVMVSIAFHTASLWLAVGMAFIRLMTLRSGTLRSHWHAVSTAWVINAIVAFVIAVLLIPTVVVTGVHKIGVDNESCPGQEVGIYTILVIPCALLLILSVDLLLHLREANQRRKRMMGSSKEANIQKTLGTAELATKLARRRQAAQDRTNAVLMVVLIVFIVTELPQGLVQILTAIYTTDIFSRLYVRIGDMLDLLSLINSSLNFILYAIMSSKYRQTFWLVLCPKRIHSRFFTLPTTTTNEAAATSIAANKTRTTISQDVGSGFRRNRKRYQSFADRIRKTTGAIHQNRTVAIKYRSQSRQETGRPHQNGSINKMQNGSLHAPNRMTHPSSAPDLPNMKKSIIPVTPVSSHHDILHEDAKHPEELDLMLEKETSTVSIGSPGSPLVITEYTL